MVDGEQAVRARLRAGKLAALLARSRMSQNGWARRLGVSSAYLSQMLSGKRRYPGARVRRALIEQLDVRFEDLFDLEGGEESRKVVQANLGTWSLRVERRHPAFTDTDPAGAFESMLQDLKLSVRTLRRQPILTLVAAVTLALGIGANSAVFTLTRAVFGNTLDVKEIDTVVAIFGTVETTGAEDPGYFPLSWPNYEDLLAQNTTLWDISASAFVGGRVQAGSNDDESLQLNGMLVSSNYFDLLGVEPAVGRLFDGTEDAPLGAHPVMVLSHAMWQTDFGGDEGLVGGDVRINGHELTVIGIAAEGFGGTAALFDLDFWVPISTHPQLFPYSDFVDARRWRMFALHGQLRPGITAEQAEADLRTISARLADEYPDDNAGRLARVLPLEAAALPPAQRPLFERIRWMLTAVVGFVLLIACANVANLTLARAATRARDIALRLALGASRTRVATQLLIESVLLAVAGGVLALPVARIVRDLLWANRPAQLPQSLDVSIDVGVVAFTFVITLLTGVLFGLAPALQASGADLGRALQQRAPTGTRAKLRGLLVVAQVGLSFVAVIGAGLFLSSLREMASVDPGFAIDRMLIGEISPGGLGYSQDEGEAFYREIIERLDVEPGIEAVAFSGDVPLQFTTLSRTTIREGDSDDTAILIASNTVSEQYFETMEVPIVAGRGFTSDDTAGSTPAIVINQTMANRLWSGADPVGRRVRFLGEDTLWEIVGVVADIKYNSLAEDPQPYFYHSLPQRYAAGGVLVIRSADPAGAVNRVRAAAREVDRGATLDALAPASLLADQALEAPRAAAMLLSAFALLALTLAAVGIYGVLAQLVVQRRREIGVRIAVGASAGAVVRLVTAQSLRWVASGAVLGGLIAVVAGRSVGSLLFGVRATDPTTYIVTGAVLVVAALLAAGIPSRRATLVDPVVALREE